MTRTDQDELTIISRRTEFLLNKYNIETPLTAARYLRFKDYRDVETTDAFIHQLKLNREIEPEYEKHSSISTQHSAVHERTN